jgi:hypothetical protein
MINDATTALLRAIRAKLGDFPGFSLEEISSRSWASVTFVGARHQLAFRLDGDGADAAASAFVDGLDSAEFTLRGHILADIALVSEERMEDCATIRLEALTVEDG